MNPSPVNISDAEPTAAQFGKFITGTADGNARKKLAIHLQFDGRAMDSALDLSYWIPSDATKKAAGTYVRTHTDMFDGRPGGCVNGIGIEGRLGVETLTIGLDRDALGSAATHLVVKLAALIQLDCPGSDPMDCVRYAVLSAELK